MNVRIVKNENLTRECWSIQFCGIGYCKTCEHLGKRSCGGKNIRKTFKNEKGVKVPIS